MLGKDQSPGGGHSAAVSAMPCRARQGRSSSTISFTASLTAYASTVPMPVSTVPAETRVSPCRTALHQTHASSRPRTTRVPSVAASSSGPAQEGASATASVIERYADADAPPVTSTAPAVPGPPGASPTTAAAPTPSTAQADSGRVVRVRVRVRVLLPVSRLMNVNLGAAGAADPGRTAGLTPDDRRV
ncbi:hypothetical protein ACFV8E_22445 [Streptomyces sp. NPDC059849]|uniref:hypothetical protein n=1 Tax=Streptomyces sp. NPDC059849 TaxID=3346969 RepID=UPI00365FFDEB